MKNHLNLCLFNHDKNGVTDQVEEIIDILSDVVNITVSKNFDIHSNNLLIENFNNYQVDKLRHLKKINNRRLFVMLTEHIETDIDSTLYLNNQKWDQNREYIPNLYNRFVNLISMGDIIDAYIVLYNLPNVMNIRKILPSAILFDLRSNKKFNLDKVYEKKIDFCFVGALTDYRIKILNQLSTKFNVKYDSNISFQMRTKLIKESKYVLNIPQFDSWKNISPMRILSAAREGVATINITDQSDHKFPYSETISIDNLMALDSDQIDLLMKDVQKNGERNHLTSDKDNFLKWLE